MKLYIHGRTNQFWLKRKRNATNSRNDYSWLMEARRADDEEDSKRRWNREGECRRRNSCKNWEGKERARERGETFSLVLVAILLGASTVVATRCVHRADERLVKEHGKALLNHSRRRASLRPCYFGYHDTDTLFHQISLRAYINFPLTSLAFARTYG